MKVVAIIFGVLILLVLVVAGAGYVWWDSHKDTLRAELHAAMDDGRTLGSHGTPVQCVDAAAARTKTCDGFMCEVNDKAFLRACMGATNLDMAFCRTVPRIDSISVDAITRAASWATKICRAQGADNQVCGKVVLDTVKYCSRPAG